MANRISFSPNVINLKPSNQEQTVTITVTLQEPIISPSGYDIGLKIQFVSAIIGITIPDAIWSEDTVGVPQTRTVTLTIPANQEGNGKNIIMTTVVTNSEMYTGFVPAFTVNYMPAPIMGSLYTNNAMVYYKTGSVSSGIGSVRNHRIKGRLT